MHLTASNNIRQFQSKVDKRSYIHHERWISTNQRKQLSTIAPKNI